MARRCEITGKKPMTGNHVSHAHNLNKRRWLPNLQKKRIYIPEEDRWVTLKLTTKALKTIDKRGIGPVLRDLRKRGIEI